MVRQLKESFLKRDRVATGRCMGFAQLKTNWIGFGDSNWGEFVIGTNIVRLVPDLRVLGYRFQCI